MNNGTAILKTVEKRGSTIYHWAAELDIHIVSVFSCIFILNQHVIISHSVQFQQRPSNHGAGVLTKLFTQLVEFLS